MVQFMGKDFLLSTKVAKTIYHNFAADMPIIDYHCHVSPKEIFERMIVDKRFEEYKFVWAFHMPEKFDVPKAKKIKTDTHYANMVPGLIFCQINS